MPSTAVAMTAWAQSLGYDALSDRNTLLSLVGYFAGQTGTTAEDAIAAAAALNYPALSERALIECILKGSQ